MPTHPTGKEFNLLDRTKPESDKPAKKTAPPEKNHA
jgi:hypothetical protein